LGIEVDVRDHEAVEAMVARVVQAWGLVDVLVANAVGGRGRPTDKRRFFCEPTLCDLFNNRRIYPSLRLAAILPGISDSEGEITGVKLRAIVTAMVIALPTRLGLFLNTVAGLGFFCDQWTNYSAGQA
jgi:NAD(P)-dependent dehydrogenase (short-subunit alcohol dehydrogenase family)